MSRGNTAYPGPFVGPRLKRAREGREWTQEELADKLGVSRASIARWEAGTHEPNGINRVRLDRLLRGAVRL
jgi:transcriptional regulator with XRE-family HTH domain